VLFVVSLDSVSLSWLTNQLNTGRLPNLAALTRQGAVLPVNGVPLAGIAYPSFYTGFPAADHGIYFPYQWSPPHQQVRPWVELPHPPSIFQTLDQAPLRAVILDPPECRPESLRNLAVISGWQFHSRVLLHRWSTPAAALPALTAEFGSSPRADEVFGAPTPQTQLNLLRALKQAPRRLLQAATFYLRDSLDLLWLNCCALHVASHQYFDNRLLDAAHLTPAERAQLDSAILDIAVAYDQALGEILAKLPAGASILVFYAKGMDATSDWADLLPEMLRRILGEPPAADRSAFVRSLFPRRLREQVASLLPDDVALRLTARICSPQAGWSRTRAFALTSDGPGFIRFNLRGRERLGIVSPDAAAALFAEIEAGLRTFEDFDGDPCVDQILTPAQLLGSGARLDAYPDMIVLWNRKGTLLGRGVRSSRFGDIPRRGVGTGRSGNHFGNALAIAIPGSSTILQPSRRLNPHDFAVTILAALGLPYHHLPGYALLTQSA
jgi:hypothetical protein